MAVPTAVNDQITDAVPVAKSWAPVPANPTDPIPSPEDPEPAALDEPAKDVPKA